MPEIRLIEIETKLAFMEDTVQALNDVVCRQQRQIGELENLCQQMAERLRRLATDPGRPTSLEEEKPPHY